MIDCGGAGHSADVRDVGERDKLALLAAHLNQIDRCFVPPEFVSDF